MADKLGISNIIQLPWMSGVDAGQNERRPYFDFKANGCSAGWYIVITKDMNIQQDIGFTITRYDGSNVRNFLKDDWCEWQKSGSVISCVMSSWYASIRVAKLKFPDIFPVGGVISTLLLALFGAGVRHERQADSTKYTNRACTRRIFCLRRREVFRRNFSQKIDRSKSSLHSYVPKWVGRIHFGTSLISSGYKFYLLCKEHFTYNVGDWLRLDSRWIDGLAVKAA